MTAYYNEIDPYAAQWLRNLISAGHIAPGVVDERDIRDIKPDDLRGFTQCHFFAGIGVWSHALRRAGWPDDRPVWTGSCPCQPFSAAGRGAGFIDERHLWPHWFHLISQVNPDVIFGEQVASKDGLGWLDLVQTDLEGAGYASGAVDLCAAGVGAPHIRQRLWFVAHSDELRCAGVGWSREKGTTERSEVGGVADAMSAGRAEGWAGAGGGQATGGGEFGGMADADGGNTSAEGIQRSGQHGQQPQDASLCDEDRWPSPTNGLWRDADWLCCRDGKWRPVEPGTFPLAHGAPGRVGRLRAYGNAINAEAAEAVIRAYMEM